MRQRKKPLFLAMFVGLMVFPCAAIAAGINETKAAIGKGCVASGDYSTAMGYSTTASGGASTAMGYLTKAAGNHSFAGGGRMELTAAAYNTFVWGNYDFDGTGPQFQSISTPNAFLIFPAGTAGKVGIGTTSPQNLLDLGTSNGKKLAIYQNASRTDFYGFGISTDTLGFYAGADVSHNPGMVLKKTTGRVGIGTTSPNYLLEVDGSAGKPDGGSWSNSSDERLKDIVGEYSPGLGAIALLRPVSFYYKADNPRGLPSEKEYVGFIAQEVQQIFPEAVSEGPDGYLDFNMHPVNVAVVNAIKELKAENDEIRSENEFLRSENAILKKDIEKIKAILGI